jgi:putative glutamine amidotransferase
MVDGPLIGVTTYWARARWGKWDARAALLPAEYPRLVQRAGALAVMLPPDDPAAADGVVSRLDAVVVAGGPDVEPARYGAEPHPRTDPPGPERDAWELAVIEAALRAGTPLLGICRGLQLLNVATGGTLEQHLPDTVGHDGHTGNASLKGDPVVFDEHVVRTVPGTRLARVLPGASSVPTFHHQTVDKVGDGLVVCAHAEDGTVEALEHESAPFALGVQWHPEMGGDLRLVRALAEAAVSRARR